MKELSRLADNVFEKEATDVAVHKRLFELSKNCKPTKLWSKPVHKKCGVVTSCWNPLTPHSTLLAYWNDASNHVLGIIPFTKPNSIFVHLTCVHVFDKPSHANSFASCINDNSSTKNENGPCFAFIGSTDDGEKIRLGLNPDSRNALSFASSASMKLSNDSEPSSSSSNELTKEKKTCKKGKATENLKATQRAKGKTTTAKKSNKGDASNASDDPNDDTSCSMSEDESAAYVQELSEKADSSITLEWEDHSKRIDTFESKVQETKRKALAPLVRNLIIMCPLSLPIFPPWRMMLLLQSPAISEFPSLSPLRPLHCLRHNKTHLAQNHSPHPPSQRDLVKEAESDQ